MRILLAVSLSASICLAQEIPQPLVQAANAIQDQSPDEHKPTTIVVPAGTRLQLALANPLRTGAAHVGDSVRAVTTFPVTVGSALAIPQGAFLEGTIVRIGKRGSTLFDGLEIDFKQVVFANGYNVSLDGTVVDAMLTPPGGAVIGGPLGLMAAALPQAPTPPPLPQVGPSKAVVIGATVGGMAGLFVVVGILAHRHRHEEARDFDTGFQFEMVLQSPLTLDAGRVAAALNAPNGR